ncbi:hypothetical protein TI06_23975, partial [Vibrio vulnificus]
DATVCRDLDVEPARPLEEASLVQDEGFAARGKPVFPQVGGDRTGSAAGSHVFHQPQAVPGAALAPVDVEQ